MTNGFPRNLTEPEAAVINLSGFMAELGKKVIHPGGRPSTEQLFKMASFEAGQHVLDIGCGVGTTAILIASRFGCQVTAVDIDPSMVQRANANIRAAGLGDRVTVEQGDILNLRFPDNTFERVIIESVMMFVDRPRAAKEVARVCKPGGYVLDHEAFFPLQPPAEIVELCHKELLPGIAFEEPEDWARLFRSAGLTDIQHVSSPVKFLSPAYMIRDEGLANILRMMVRMLARPAYFRKTFWFMPRLRKVEPHISYIAFAGRKPA